jgi:cytochrome b subunit of formate dehydrogenase
MSGVKYYSSGRLAGSVILTLIVLGIGWGFVYEYAIKALSEYGKVKLDYITGKFSLTDAIWWRNFISVAFDVLIIVIAIIGTWWVLAHLIAEAKEAGKWRLYYQSEEAKRDIWVQKLTLWQRVQHVWMITTFIICAVTGLSAHWHILASRQTLLTIHVYSGLAMGVLAIIHFVQYTVMALIAKSRGESLREKFPMLEIYSRNFIRAFVNGLMAPFRGRRREGVGKYDPEQLFEYWGIYWGMLVLGIPGVVMLFEGLDALGGVLWVMHFKEAILAITFILIVHMGYTHLRPSVFPIDTTFIHGRIPLKRIREEHPAWAEKLEKTVIRVEASEVGEVPTKQKT